VKVEVNLHNWGVGCGDEGLEEVGVRYGHFWPLSTTTEPKGVDDSYL